MSLCISSPLRVTWDWNWAPVVHPGLRPVGPGRERSRLVGEELARARVLMLEVGYPGAASLQGEELVPALKGFAGQVALVLSPRTVLDLGGEKPWRRLGIEEVWVDLTPVPEEMDGRISFHTTAGGSAWPEVRIYLTSANWREATRVIRDVVMVGAGKLSLPNLPLFGSFLTSARELVPKWNDLLEFAELVEPVLRRNRRLDLRVHNQALWALLAARGLSPTGAEAPGHQGCQAGTALAYIDPGGILYPCASMPIPLGRVTPGAIAEVWAGDELAVLRRDVKKEPGPCLGCREWEFCRGGCRGWSHFLTGGWEEPGPDCGQKRDK